MNTSENGGSNVHYEPNEFGGPVEDPTKAWAPFKVEGEAGRYKYNHPNNNFE